MVVSTLTMPCDLDAKVNKSDTKGELTFPRMRKRFPKKRKQKKSEVLPSLFVVKLSASPTLYG